MIPVWSDIVYESRGGKAKIENTNIGKYKYANAKELKTQALSKSWSGRTQLGRGGSRGKVKGDNNENASLSAASLCLLLHYSVFYILYLLLQYSVFHSILQLLPLLHSVFYSILGLVPLATVLVHFHFAIVLMVLLVHLATVLSILQLVPLAMVTVLVFVSLAEVILLFLCLLHMWRLCLQYSCEE